MYLNPTYFNTVQELNDFLREVLIENSILNTDRHLNCGQTKYVSLKRSPTDKFLRSLKCEDLSCPPCNQTLSVNILTKYQTISLLNLTHPVGHL